MTISAQRGASLLISPVRRLLVDTLAARGPLDARSLADRAGLHVTTVRFHLDRLLEAGILVAEAENRASVGRPRKLYAVAPGSLEIARLTHASALARLTALLADTIETGGDRTAMTPEDAGRAWALAHVPAEPEAPAEDSQAWRAKLLRVADALAGWGYRSEIEPGREAREATVMLEDCPFLDLANSHPAVVCGVHRGLLRGALEQVGEPDVVVSLEPFVTPRRCRVTVAPLPADSGA